MYLIHNLFETKFSLIKSDIIYYFNPYDLWSVLLEVSVFCLPCSWKSLLNRCTINWVVWNYILFNSLLRAFECIKSVSIFRIQYFSLIFNNFLRANLSRFVWLSCSITKKFKLCISVSKRFDAGVLLGLTFFVYLISLILNSVIRFLVSDILNILIYSTNICDHNCNYSNHLKKALWYRTKNFNNCMKC